MTQATAVRQAAAAAPDVAGNAGYSMFASAYYLVTRLALPPLVLAHISLVEYGLWSACFVLIMYIGLADSGFANVYVRFTALYHARGEDAAISRLLSTGVFTLAPLALLVLGGLWLLLPEVLAFIRTPEHLFGEARLLIIGAAAMFLLDLTLGAYCYLLHGLQRIREEKKIAMAGFTIEFVFIVIFLQLGAGVYALLAAFCLRYLYSLAGFIRLARRLLPDLRLSPRLYDKSLLRHFFGFGLAIQASTLCATALHSLDRVLAGWMLGPQGVALFELAAKMPLAAVSVPAAISNVAMPAAARHSAAGEHQAFNDLYLGASRATALLAGWPLAILAVFAAPLMQLWLGDRPGLELLPAILTLIAMWSHLHIITGPGTAVFRARGSTRNEFVYHGLRIIGLAVFLGVAWRIFGAGAEMLMFGFFAGGVFAAGGYIVWNQHRLGLPLRDLWRLLAPAAAIGYPVAVALYWLWQVSPAATLGRPAALALLLLFALGHTLIWATLAWRLLSEHERSWLRGRGERFYSSLAKWRRA